MAAPGSEQTPNNNNYEIASSILDKLAQVLEFGIEQDEEAKKQQRRLQRKNRLLHYEATHDSLTNLLNNQGLKEVLDSNRPPRAMLYVDGTGGKRVNDLISHKRGDEAIVEIANVLLKSLRPGDIVARVGGDEFLVLLDTERRSGEEPLSPQEQLVPVISRIGVETKVVLDNNPDLAAVGFDIAVGGAVWQEGMSVNDLVGAAEAAMYAHKDKQHQESRLHR